MSMPWFSWDQRGLWRIQRMPSCWWNPDHRPTFSPSFFHLFWASLQLVLPDLLCSDTSDGLATEYDILCWLSSLSPSSSPLFLSSCSWIGLRTCMLVWKKQKSPTHHAHRISIHRSASPKSKAGCQQLIKNVLFDITLTYLVPVHSTLLRALHPFAGCWYAAAAQRVWSKYIVQCPYQSLQSNVSHKSSHQQVSYIPCVPMLWPCLQDIDTSWWHIGHPSDEGVVLELDSWA